MVIWDAELLGTSSNSVAQRCELSLVLSNIFHNVVGKGGGGQSGE